MNHNIFEEIKQKKESFRTYIERAKELKWLSNEEAIDFTDKIENDKLTLGVIGQMKCGKSTFLNALIFKDEVLPAATTPMTASLSIITYGEKKKLEVEFFTKEDWEELKLKANRNIQEAGSDERKKSEIKAAKELFEGSSHLGSSINSLLGTKKEANFDDLEEYVGAGGKYTSITKTVRIEYPLDYLKGVEIVDTPGFNDPIVSREERTKDFLQKADAVLMLLYAGRAFDATDKDIIFNKVGSIGVGKVLIGVNKYDLCYNEGETKEEILTNIKKQLREASKEYPGSAISELIQEHEPLLLSANMALMSQMELSKITSDDSTNFYYKKVLDDFEIQTQAQVYEKSLMRDFEAAIKSVVIDSKTEILIKKPLNFIKQKGESKLKELLGAKTKLDNSIIVLSKTDNELEDLQGNLDKIKKRYNRRIEGFETDIKENLKKESKILTFDVEDNVEKTKKGCYDLVDDKIAVLSLTSLYEKIDYRIEQMQRKLNRDFSNCNDNINFSIRSMSESFVNELEVLMDKFLVDFDSEGFLKVLQKYFMGEIVNVRFNDLIPVENEEHKDLSLFEKAFVITGYFLEGATFGALSGVGNILSGKADTKQLIETFFNKIDLNPITTEIERKGKELVLNVKKEIEQEFLQPIEEDIKSILDKKESREKELATKKDELRKTEESLSLFKEEYSEMEGLALAVN
ncbi:hypothetical protein HMPREF9714_02402 [Myroides odoratimimus CCUG 12901]|uniref:dynamin family protein n=1 Tax=Myroides odoratimimus TaxID=76832 RepID=UPI000245F8FF|nr:dynamin family protein [Myroides odoratimimus]EHO07804.1 hypothetical protein HMPREF9714_02402 [Myroides odoratimimus CCUG 12901]